MSGNYSIYAAKVTDGDGNAFDGWEVTEYIDEVPVVVATILDRDFAAFLKSILTAHDRQTGQGLVCAAGAGSLTWP